MVDPRYVTLDELRALVLPLAERIGQLRAELAATRAELADLAAKMPDQSTEGDPPK